MQRYLMTSIACAALAACASPNTDHGSAPAKRFETDTWLYHKDQGAKLFQAGERHPGRAWHDNPTSAATGELAPEDITPKSSEEIASTVADLQAQLAEQKRQFDAAWDGLKSERDTLQSAKASLETENAELRRKAAATDEELLATLEANVALTAEVEALKGQVAKFDPDGDGKVGGSAPKDPAAKK